MLCLYFKNDDIRFDKDPDLWLYGRTVKFNFPRHLWVLHAKKSNLQFLGSCSSWKLAFLAFAYTINPINQTDGLWFRTYDDAYHPSSNFAKLYGYKAAIYSYFSPEMC